MTRSTHVAIDYIRTLYAREDAVLTRINQKLEAEGVAWQVGPEEGKLLHMLVKMSGAKQVVEVGTLGGYSAIWMARALPEGGHITSIEKNPEHAAWAREFIQEAGLAGSVTVLEGDAGEILTTLSADAPFDMLFIDADKAGYPHYLDWAELNIRSGGMIVADNTLMFGAAPMEEYVPIPKVSKIQWQAMRSFNTRLADASLFTALMIPTDEGMSVAIRC